MAAKLGVHEGVIRPSLVQELERYRAPDGRVSSYYLNLATPRGPNAEAEGSGPDQGPSDARERSSRRDLQGTLRRESERIERLELPHATRQALLRDWELVQELALAAVGERYTQALACFVASGAESSRRPRFGDADPNGDLNPDPSRGIPNSRDFLLAERRSRGILQ